MQLVALPRAYYLNGGKGFWTAAFAVESGTITKAEEAKIVKALAGVWIVLPTTQGKALLGDLGDLQPAKLAAAATVATGTLSAGAPKVVGGTAALPITSSAGDTVWLATSGAPLPVEVTGKIPGLNASGTGASGASGGLGLGGINGSTGSSSTGSAGGATTGTLAFTYPARLAITAPKGAKTLAQAVTGAGGGG